MSRPSSGFPTHKKLALQFFSKHIFQSTQQTVAPYTDCFHKVVFLQGNDSNFIRILALLQHC